LYAPAWLVRLAYLVKVRSSHELKSARQSAAPADLRVRLEVALKQLPGEQSLVVELAYRSKWSREEIAPILNCSVESVTALMIEGTRALKRAI